MEQPVTDISINVNEMKPTNERVVSSSPSLTENKRGKHTKDKSTNRRIRFPFRSSQLEQQSTTPQDSAKKIHANHSDSQKGIVPSLSANNKTKNARTSLFSVGESKLNEIIQDLDEYPIEEEAFEDRQIPLDGYSKWIRQSRQFFAHAMEEPKFHYTIIVLIIIDLIIVFVELVVAQLTLPCLTDEELESYNVTVQRTECLLPPTHSVETGELFLFYVSLTLISIFVIEILIAFYTFGWRRYTKLLYLFDAIIVLVSFILEVYFHFGNIGKVGKASAGLVVLRLWKIIRAIHAIAHSMSLRNHMIVQEIEKAREMLNEEKAQAESTIQQQQIQIDYLTAMIDKSNKEMDPDQINSSLRKRTKSLDSMTLL